MKKTKKGKNVFGGALIAVFLLGVSQINHLRGSVLGTNSGNGNNWGIGFGNGGNNGDNYEGENDNNQPSASPTVTHTPTPSEVELEITPTPSSVPTEVLITQTPTEVIYVSPTQNKQPEPIQVENTSSAINVPVVLYKDVVSVPVAQKSVVQGSPQTVQVSQSRSILKTIQNKIEQVGGSGQIITQPKPKVIPTTIPTALKKEKEEVDTLTGNVSLFYKFSNGSVVLGAEKEGGEGLNIPEGDLRRAEISMGTVLKKEGLSLGVSGDDQFVLRDKNYLVLSSMPVLVNIDDRKIFLDTGSDKQELSTLPDAAVETAIELKAFDKLSGDKPPVLGVVGGELGYDVVGDKSYKLFGLLPVTTKVHVYVMVGSKDVVEGEQSFLTKAIRLMSL